MMRTHYKVNVSVVGHKIPGVIEYDPAISAQSFKTIDGLIKKFGLLEPGAYIQVYISVVIFHAWHERMQR